MKKLILLMILIISNISFAQEGSVKEQAFKMTGFTITVNNSTELGLVHSSGVDLIISKEFFHEEEEASDFCKARKRKLDTEFNVLLLAMSGAANHNDLIKKSITFEFMGESGIWEWTGAGENNILAIFDGRGLDGQEFNVDKLYLDAEQEGLDIEISIPAICTKLTEAQVIE